MSVKVSSWVWHDVRTADIKGNEMLAMLALADVADDDGNVVFLRDDSRTQDAIAAKARMSVATFRRAIAGLVEKGLVEVSRESQRTENEYRILLTAQSERSQVSGLTAQSERSERSQVSGHSSYRRNNVTTRVVPAARGTRIPDPFEVTPVMVAWAKEHTPLVDGRRSTERFINYWAAKTGRDATKLDWERTWRNWLLKDQEDAERRGGARLSPTDRALATLSLAEPEQTAVPA